MCGFCGQAPETHGDSDAGPMSVCPPRPAECAAMLQQARELLENVDDWGHPGTHNGYIKDVARWLAEVEPLLIDGSMA